MHFQVTSSTSLPKTETSNITILLLIGTCGFCKAIGNNEWRSQNLWRSQCRKLYWINMILVLLLVSFDPMKPDIVDSFPPPLVTSCSLRYLKWCNPNQAMSVTWQDMTHVEPMVRNPNKNLWCFFCVANAWICMWPPEPRFFSSKCVSSVLVELLFISLSNQQQHSGFPGLQRACLMAIGRLSKVRLGFRVSMGFPFCQRCEKRRKWHFPKKEGACWVPSPKLTFSPLNMGHPKRKRSSRLPVPSIFRCYVMLVSGRVTLTSYKWSVHYPWFSSPKTKDIGSLDCGVLTTMFFYRHPVRGRTWHPYGLSVWVSSQQLLNQQLEGVMAEKTGSRLRLVMWHDVTNGHYWYHFWWFWIREYSYPVP